MGHPYRSELFMQRIEVDVGHFSGITCPSEGQRYVGTLHCGIDDAIVEPAMRRGSWQRQLRQAALRLLGPAPGQLKARGR